MRYVWIFISGKYFNPEGCVDSAWKNKQALLSHIKKQGFRFSKEQDVFLDDTRRLWGKIEKHDIQA